MPESSSDWRVGSRYDYFDDLAPEQVAFEFLRRHPDYAPSYRQRETSLPRQRPTCARAVQCALGVAISAADPASQADPAPIIWMPEHNPRLALLIEAPALLPIGPTLDTALLAEDSRGA